MDNEVTFTIFKNIIIAQNKLLLKQIANKTGLDEKYLFEKYLRPEYYLPVIRKQKKHDHK